MSILDFIAFIGKFGGSIPLILAFLDSVAKAWGVLQDGIAAASGKPVALKVVLLTAEEMAACDALHDTHLKAIPGQPVAAFDGHRIIGLMKFIKANPEFLSTLQTLLPIILAMFGKPTA